MMIDRFRHEDMDVFLALAAREGWICDPWEFDFLLRAFPDGCLVGRQAGGPVGFITSVKYGCSGWVGNLVVTESKRGRGLGRALMTTALAVLHAAGTETVWLTASAAGQPLYAKLGFHVVDEITRWVGSGNGGGSGLQGNASLTGIETLDAAGWGDDRGKLLKVIAARGRVRVEQGGFLICQPSSSGTQIGPWGGVNAETAGMLLDESLSHAAAGERLFLDVPAGNPMVGSMLESRGFQIRGHTLLMCKGIAPAYNADYVYALASMGSLG